MGAVGPLAGQTLKILRRHGLERLIHSDSFHYLCDLPQQLSQYHLTPQRFEFLFNKLIDSIKKLMAEEGAEKMRLRDFSHHLPITLEWIDAREVLFERVGSHELEALYNEMQVLNGFIAHEFRRNFAIGQDEVSFFNKIGDVEAVALQAKWMADYKRGSYGPPLPENVMPDFVIFGTPADKAENDRSYFFPSFACTELVVSQNSAQLFAKVNYGFSVFLEEQMTLAEHFYRSQGQESIGDLEYGAYFDDKSSLAKEELEKLKTDLKSLDAENSPEYLALLKEEEESYQERYRIFSKDQEFVANSHNEVSEASTPLS